MAKIITIESSLSTTIVVYGETIKNFFDHTISDNNYPLPTGYYQTIGEWLEKQISEGQHKGTDCYYLDLELSRIKTSIALKHNFNYMNESIFSTPFAEFDGEIVAGEEDEILSAWCEYAFSGEVKSILEIPPIENITTGQACTLEGEEIVSPASHETSDTYIQWIIEHYNQAIL